MLKNACYAHKKILNLSKRGKQIYEFFGLKGLNNKQMVLHYNKVPATTKSVETCRHNSTTKKNINE